MADNRVERSGSGKKGNVIEYPENYEEMMGKLQAREKEQLERLFEKRNVGSIQDLETIAKETIQTRSLRVTKEHETLKDHKILHEPKADDIKTLRQRLAQEVSEYARAAIQQFPQYKTNQNALRGRITLGRTEEAVEESSISGI